MTWREMVTLTQCRHLGSLIHHSNATETTLADRPKSTNLFWGKHPIKVCIKITRLLNEMLTHGAAVSEKREKKMNARQMDVNKKGKKEHELAAEEGGQNMPKKGFISKRGT